MLNNNKQDKQNNLKIHVTEPYLISDPFFGSLDLLDLTSKVSLFDWARYSFFQ